MATLESRIAAFVTRSSTQAKKLATQINGNLTDLSTLKTSVKTSLLSAINELFDTRMITATYDSNGNGKVDAAELADATPWLGITGRPSTFPPSAHDASLITTGTLDLARLPMLPGSKTIVVTTIGALTQAQQDSIGEGSLLAITGDGLRYMYSGTGSKLDTSSYVTIADVTPVWTAIEAKPTTTTGYGITDLGNTDRDFVALFESGLS